jgi:hypothetical protein
MAGGIIPESWAASTGISTLELPRDEARALAQIVKLIDYNMCVKWSSMTRTYGPRSEHDVMWSAVCMLERQLAEAGLEPR